MPSPDEIKKKTDELLQSDESDEEKEVPTQFPTPSQETAAAAGFPLAQSQCDYDLSQTSVGLPAASGPNQVTPWVFPAGSQQNPSVSQLTQGSQVSNPFSQLERMLQLQSQAQTMPFPNYPPHIAGIPFGSMQPEAAQQAAKAPPKSAKKNSEQVKDDEQQEEDNCNKEISRWHQQEERRTWPPVHR